MTDSERTAKANSFEEYANQKLETNGYKVMLSENGILMNEAATAAVKSGIKVGDIVTGYTVTEKSYTTSGEENTAPSSTETDQTKQTVTANTKLTWKYLGVNANGELEIMADFGTAVAADNTKVKLSGKGGYLKGPRMLNIICEKLYSVSEVGTARSMNIDDVNNILGYTGEKGAYFSGSNGSYTTTKEVKTIAALESESGTTLRKRTTPDGKDLGTYYSDYYTINKTNDVKEMKSPGNRDLVYNAKNIYWLASPCVSALFDLGYANFYVRYVNSTYVHVVGMFNSVGVSNYYACAVRPVVSLKSNIQLTQNTEKTAWEIELAQN